MLFIIVVLISITIYLYFGPLDIIVLCIAQDGFIVPLSYHRGQKTPPSFPGEYQTPPIYINYCNRLLRLPSGLPLYSDPYIIAHPPPSCELTESYIIILLVIIPPLLRYA